MGNCQNKMEVVAADAQEWIESAAFTEDANSKRYTADKKTGNVKERRIDGE